MISASAQSKHRAVFLALMAGSLLGCRGKSNRPSIDAGPAEVLSGSLLPSDLEGSVQDRAGAPIPDALIIAWPKGRKGERVAQARSGDDGRFLLPRLVPGRWSLLVEAGGIGTLETERQVPEDGAAVLMLDGSCRSLTGVVEGDGRRQAGAHVTLGSPSLRWTRAATTDTNGVFSMAGLGNGRFTLRATLGGRASASSVVAIDDSSPRPPHVRLSLQSGTLIDGRVVDDTGRPLAGATVDVLTMPSDDLPVSSQSDRDGRFRMGPVASGKYQILARHEGYVLMAAPEPQLGSRPMESFELRLARAARVSGRVLDDNGRPMAAVQVFATSLIGGHDELVVIPGALPLAAEAAELPIGQLAHPGGARSSPTDGDGRFTIDGLSPGRSRVEVLHPGKLPLRHEPVLLVPGDVRDVGDLTLSTGATLAGKVVDEQGQAVEGAAIEARLASRLPRPPLRAISDARGEFVLRVPLGDYHLTAQTQGLVLAAPFSIRVQGDVATDACNLRMVPRPPRPAPTGATRERR